MVDKYLLDYTKTVLIMPRVTASRFNGTLLRLINAPRLTFPLLAAHTPLDGVSLKIIDENVDGLETPTNMSTSADIVGISAMTPTAFRAYEIADMYRKHGITVVLGGIHPSVLPDEALQHADVVVKGQGGAAWRQILDDFRKGDLKSVYTGSTMTNPRQVSLEREVVTNKSVYNLSTVQTSEGCPNNCNFCSVKLLNPHFIKYELEDIMRDIRSTESKYIVFVDDNLWSDKRFAKELFRRMSSLGKRWISQAPIGIALDSALLSTAAKSGCVGVYIGIDTIIEESIKEAKKRPFDVKMIPEYIKTIQDHGIFVEAGVIFGFDGEDTSVFERTLAFYDRTSVDSLNFHILTPYPGTLLYQSLDAQQRILHREWDKYDTMHVVFKPTDMTPEQLQEGYDWAWRKSFSLNTIARRVLHSGRPTYSALIQLTGMLNNSSPLGKLLISNQVLDRCITKFVRKRLHEKAATFRETNNIRLYDGCMRLEEGCGMPGSDYREEHYMDRALCNHL
jgi:radical SAM superfamily enzyme YgiQ (UPF0313 family)